MYSAPSSEAMRPGNWAIQVQASGTVAVKGSKVRWWLVWAKGYTQYQTVAWSSRFDWDAPSWWRMGLPELEPTRSMRGEVCWRVRVTSRSARSPAWAEAS